MSTFIENSKISVKIISVICLLALVVVCVIGFASVNMATVSQAYGDQIQRVDVAVVENARASREIVEYGHRAYALAMETSDEGNVRLLAELAASRQHVTSQFQKIREALPENRARIDAFEGLFNQAVSVCADPIKDAGATTNAAQIVKAGGRLAQECDPSLSAAIDNGKKLTDELMAQSRQKSDALDARVSRMILTSLGVTVLGLLVAVVVGLWIASRGITQPINLLSAVMARFAHNELDAEVPGTARGDELGAMARTVQVFKQNALERRAMEAREREEIAIREKRAQSISSLTQDFDAKAADLLGIINHAAGALKGTAQSMSDTAEQTTHQALEVSTAADQASSNVQTVATAAEELSASILEISRQVDQSAKVAAAAASDAEQTNRTVQSLAESSARIGEVVSLINDIASQTNLLALNATIEAARAGDAGKGFAVVAGEVKTLATQTARATDEIGQQIAAVQAATTQAVAAIAGIVKRIAEINMIAAAISSAVEEQSAATSEIARNIQEAATGTQRVSNNIGGVNQAASETRVASDQVLTASESLISQSAYLESEVSNFLSGVRAA
jgi:methyl-accepting chemotaxis protein